MKSFPFEFKDRTEPDPVSSTKLYVVWLQHEGGMLSQVTGPKPFEEATSLRESYARQYPEYRYYIREAMF